MDFAGELYAVLDGQRSLAWVPLDDVVLMRAAGSPELQLPEVRHVPKLAEAADAPPRMALVQGTAVCRAVVDALEPSWNDRVQFLTSITSYGKTLLTLTAKGADKGVALTVACRDHGIDPSEVVAIGDSDNDIAMFRVAGIHRDGAGQRSREASGHVGDGDERRGWRGASNREPLGRVVIGRRSRAMCIH